MLLVCLITLYPMWYVIIASFSDPVTVSTGAVTILHKGNVVLVRTFFENVPDSMEESAKIDGANDWRILSKIYLPLPLPAIATITMYYFVGRWNAYFWSMLLLKDQDKIPLQVLLKKLIVKVSYTVNEAVDMSSILKSRG